MTCENCKYRTGRYCIIFDDVIMCLGDTCFMCKKR